MVKKIISFFHWLPTLLYGLIMLIVAVVYGIKWDLTLTIGWMLFSLIVLVPMLLFSILNTAIKTKKTQSTERKYVQFFYLLNIAATLLLVTAAVVQIVLLFGRYDWWVYTIPLIVGIVFYVFAITFLIRKNKKESQNEER